MAKVNQMMPLSGQPNRFSLHMEINQKTTQVMPRNTISQRLKALIAKFWLHWCRWASLCRLGESN